MKMNNKVLVPLVSGFEETEYIAVRDVLIREGFDVDSVSLTGDKTINANHGTKIGADFLYSNIRNALYDYDTIFIPGGSIGVKNLDKSIEFDTILNEFIANNKIVAAICSAPTLLAKKGVLKDKEAVVFPSKSDIKVLKDNGAIYNPEVNFISDGNYFTGKDMQSSIEFGYALADFIKAYSGK